MVHSGIPENLEELLDLYGKPDKVAWGYYYHTRNLIWSQRGILAEVDLLYDDTTMLFLFSPISISNFYSSWLINIIPQEGLKCPGEGDDEPLDFICLGPEQEIENPWDF